MAEIKKTKIDDSKMTEWREEDWKNYQKHQKVVTPKKKTRTIMCLSTMLVVSSLATLNKVNAQDEVQNVNQLMEEYYNESSYVKATSINLKEESVAELKEYNSGWHSGASLLERITYYEGNTLWMSRGDGTYAYYGTDSEGNLTSATATEPLQHPANPKLAVKKGVNTPTQTWDEKDVGMEGYYITLKDIAATNESLWTKEGNVYSSSNEEIIQMFKGFTAPCYIGFDNNTKNYIDLYKAEIEETVEGLELRLIAHSTDYDKLKSGNVFSKAVVTKGNHVHDFNATFAKEYIVGDTFSTSDIKYDCACKYDPYEIVKAPSSTLKLGDTVTLKAKDKEKTIGIPVTENFVNTEANGWKKQTTGGTKNNLTVEYVSDDSSNPNGYIKFSRDRNDTWALYSNSNFAAPTSDFDILFRAKVTNDRSHIRLRTELYDVMMVFDLTTKGERIISANYNKGGETYPHSNVLDTSQWHDYKISVKKGTNGIFTYDIYMDNKLILENIDASATGTNLLMIGVGEKAKAGYNKIAMCLEYLKIQVK